MRSLTWQRRTKSNRTAHQVGNGRLLSYVEVHCNRFSILCQLGGVKVCGQICRRTKRRGRGAFSLARS